jgi:thiamine-phosphate pyrophosphorylase
LTPADLERCRLYGIVDLSYVEISEAEGIAGQMISGGVDLIQLRAKALPSAEIAKIAAAMHDSTSRRGVPLVINDHPEIARIVPAEGVHVGQDDLPIADAREMAGPNCVVGKSTHSVDQAIRAFYEGADYIGFGPIFATPTKPDYAPVGLEEIRKVHEAVHIPIFCIGGIKLDNLPKVIEAGARRVVIVSGLLQAKDIAAYGRAAKALLNRKPNPPAADANPKS